MPPSFMVVSDAAGEVAETGSGVTRFKKGDRVTVCLYQNWALGKVQPADASLHALGGPLNGALAEYVLLEEEGSVHTGIINGHRVAFEQMNAIIEAHGIKPVIDSVYTFKDAKRPISTGSRSAGQNRHQSAVLTPEISAGII